jgi:aldehyde oxidoreductase
MIKKVINVNGIGRTIIIDPDVSLANVLREQLGFTGTKIGCDTGQCGACSVIMDGKVIRSCITKMKRVPDDANITTIEGIGTPDNLHPLQLAFAVHGAAQCGFCTSGFIVSAKAMLDQNSDPNREEVRDWFQKHRYVETPREYGPFGAGGVGEMPLTSPHAATVNAIHNATGVRIRNLPALPEKVLAGLKALA